MYEARPDRYNKMQYRRCGSSGVLLPALSLGLWHNFGDKGNFDSMKTLILSAFDMGITHFDLANNYGPPPGKAEENFGKILSQELTAHRDELLISTKAGYFMWEGPYGDWGSRKYLIASLNQSLRRMNLEYVDIFYSHRFDPNTPLEETMGALDYAVKSGKALYAGISNYPPEKMIEAYEILKGMGTPLLIDQPKYSMLDRKAESGVLDTAKQLSIGVIVFSALAQGVLTGKYLGQIPSDSRAVTDDRFLKASGISEETHSKVKALAQIASARGQSLAQMALSFLLKDDKVTSVLIGASKPQQISENIGCLDKLSFSEEELLKIDQILCGE